MERYLKLKEMKKIIFYIMSIFYLFQSCDGQTNDKNNKIKVTNEMKNLKEAPYNLSDEGDGNKYNYDSLSVEIINSAKLMLESKKFQFPTNGNFDKKIQEVFGFQLSEYKNSIFVLEPSMFPEVAIRKHNFVLIQDSDLDTSDFLNPDLLYHYNAYVFYKSQDSFLWLEKNDPEILNNLVIHYGYTGDKKLVENVLKNYDFESLSGMEELIFKYGDKKKELKKEIFVELENFVENKKSMSSLNLTKQNVYSQFGKIIDKIAEHPNEYLDSDNMIAYLFEKELRVGINLDLKTYILNNQNFAVLLEENNYYDLPKLKEYILSKN